MVALLGAAVLLAAVFQPCSAQFFGQSVSEDEYSDQFGMRHSINVWTDALRKFAHDKLYDPTTPSPQQFIRPVVARGTKIAQLPKSSQDRIISANLLNLILPRFKEGKEVSVEVAQLRPTSGSSEPAPTPEPAAFVTSAEDEYEDDEYEDDDKASTVTKTTPASKTMTPKATTTTTTAPTTTITTTPTIKTTPLPSATAKTTQSSSTSTTSTTPSSNSSPTLKSTPKTIMAPSVPPKPSKKFSENKSSKTDVPRVKDEEEKLLTNDHLTRTTMTHSVKSSPETTPVNHLMIKFRSVDEMSEAEKKAYESDQQKESKDGEKKKDKVRRELRNLSGDEKEKDNSIKIQTKLMMDRSKWTDESTEEEKRRIKEEDDRLNRAFEEVKRKLKEKPIASKNTTALVTQEEMEERVTQALPQTLPDVAWGDEGSGEAEGEQFIEGESGLKPSAGPAAILDKPFKLETEETTKKTTVRTSLSTQSKTSRTDAPQTSSGANTKMKKEVQKAKETKQKEEAKASKENSVTAKTSSESESGSDDSSQSDEEEPAGRGMRIPEAEEDTDEPAEGFVQSAQNDGSIRSSGSSTTKPSAEPTTSTAKSAQAVYNLQVAF